MTNRPRRSASSNPSLRSLMATSRSISGSRAMNTLPIPAQHVELVDPLNGWRDHDEKGGQPILWQGFHKIEGRGGALSVSEPEEEDFAAMFEQSEQARRIEKGRTIGGTVVAIGEESALVDVGGKSEAEIDIDELKNEDGVLEVAVGDRIQATVVSTAGGLKLSRKLALGAVSARQLEEAFQAGLPVEGKVERDVKGGYEVRIARQRAFCPVSQIDIVRNTEPAQHIGRVYRFRITEFKEGGRNLVVSRRVLLEEEQKAAAADVRKSIVEGAVITGRVVSVRDFGAFVDLG